MEDTMQYRLIQVSILALVLMALVGPAQPTLAQEGPAPLTREMLKRVDSLQDSISRQWKNAQQQSSEATDEKKKCEIIRRAVTTIEWFMSEEGMRLGIDPKTAFVNFSGAVPPRAEEIELPPQLKERVRVHGYWILEDLRSRLPCPPPTENATAQKTGPETAIFELPGTNTCVRITKDGSGVEKAECPGGLRPRLGMVDGMTTIDPPKDKKNVVNAPGGQLGHRANVSRGSAGVGNALKGGGEPKGQAQAQGSQTVEDLDRQIGTIKRDIREIVGTENAREAIKSTQAEIDTLRQWASGIEGVVQKFGTSKEEIEQLKKDAETKSVFEDDDIYNEAGEHAVETGAGLVLALRGMYVAGSVLALAPLLGDLLEYGVTRPRLRSLKVDALEDMLRSNQIQTKQANELLAQIYANINTNIARLHKLEELQSQLTSAQNARAVEQARLDNEAKQKAAAGVRNTSRATLARETDPADDAKVRSQSEAARGVKLSPGSQPPKSTAPTITNKKASQPSSAKTTAPNNAPGQQIGQQILQGVIQSGIQSAIGRAMGGGDRRSTGGGAQAVKKSSTQTAKPPTTTSAQPQSGSAPSGPILFQGYTYTPGR
jgi:hypothetical protein